jgi:DNA-binding transcriptional ArsR family regulator
MLTDLFLSKTRVKLLQTFLFPPGKIYYVRELVRLVKEEINAVRAELARMEKLGMVDSEMRANRKYYSFRKDYLFYDELLRLVAKTTGLGGSIIKEKMKLGKVKFAMLSGTFFRGRSVGPKDVDLLLVGTIVLPQLSQMVRSAETKIGREINYTVMTEEEFNFRKRRNDPFILSVLNKSKLMLIGDEEELLK